MIRVVEGSMIAVLELSSLHFSAARTRSFLTYVWPPNATYPAPSPMRYPYYWITAGQLGCGDSTYTHKAGMSTIPYGGGVSLWMVM
jgi:hypothetical protein